jgi:hypothetical protein
MLSLLGLLAAPVAWGSQPAAAQVYEPPGDMPWPDTTPAVTPAAASDTIVTTTPVAADSTGTTGPVAAGDALPATVTDAPLGQASGDSQPAFAPVPDDGPAAPPGPWGVPPVKLMIPSLGVEAAIEAVGTDPDGAMSAPSDPDEVAWYDLGPGMGVPGNVVFAGHVNWAGRLRPFGLIDRLDVGDVIQVVDAQGRGFEYAVDSSRLVRAEGAPLEEIFAQPAEPVITLITCGGEYVASRREYLDRVIVHAKGA